MKPEWLELSSTQAILLGSINGLLSSYKMDPEHKAVVLDAVRQGMWFKNAAVDLMGRGLSDELKEALEEAKEQH